MLPPPLRRSSSPRPGAARGLRRVVVVALLAGSGTIAAFVPLGSPVRAAGAAPVGPSAPGAAAVPTTTTTTATTATTAPASTRPPHVSDPPEGPGYGGDAGTLHVEVVRHAGESAAGPTGPAAGATVSVRVSGGGWLASSALVVDVPGEPKATAVTDETGSFRTVVPVTGGEAPSGTVRVRGAGPDLLPRELQAVVPVPAATVDPRLLLLAAAATALAASVVVPQVRRRRLVAASTATGRPQ